MGDKSSGEKVWRALVVDDQAYMRSLLRAMLQQMGIDHVEEFENGESCLSRLRLGDFNIPDLVFVDWHMAGMDGYSFCNAVRLDKDLRSKGIPIIMVTGEKDAMLLEQARDMGVKAIVHKPVSLPKLKEALSKAFGTSAPAQGSKASS